MGNFISVQNERRATRYSFIKMMKTGGTFILFLVFTTGTFFETFYYNDEKMTNLMMFHGGDYYFFTEADCVSAGGLPITNYKECDRALFTMFQELGNAPGNAPGKPITDTEEIQLFQYPDCECYVKQSDEQIYFWGKPEDLQQNNKFVCKRFVFDTFQVEAGQLKNEKGEHIEFQLTIEHDFTNGKVNIDFPNGKVKKGNAPSNQSNESNEEKELLEFISNQKVIELAQTIKKSYPEAFFQILKTEFHFQPKFEAKSFKEYKLEFVFSKTKESQKQLHWVIDFREEWPDMQYKNKKETTCSCKIPGTSPDNMYKNENSAADCISKCQTEI